MHFYISLQFVTFPFISFKSLFQRRQGTPPWYISLHWSETETLNTHWENGLTMAMTGFPAGSAGKESAYNVGDLGWIPGLGRFPWRRERLSTPVFWPENSINCTVQRVAKSQTRQRLSLFMAMVEQRSSVPILGHHADPLPCLTPSQHLLFSTPIPPWISLSTEEAQEMSSQSESSTVWLWPWVRLQRAQFLLSPWYYFPSTKTEEIQCTITHMALIVRKFIVWILSKVPKSRYINIYAGIMWLIAYEWPVLFSSLYERLHFLHVVRYMSLFLLNLPEE